MSKYAEVDKAITAAINDGCVRLCEIVGRTGQEERLIDRRLQSLRRAGKIKYSSDYGWGIRD